MSTSPEHWRDIARRWDQVGPPLRPAPTDVAVYTALVEEWARANGPPRALILGVTPELYRLPWPGGSTVSAVDHTPSMIEAVWPGPRSAVVCADWTELPLEAGSRDIALCDGGLHLLAHPHDQSRLVRELYRVLAPNGVFLLRLFTPRERESAGTVLDELLAGKISNPNMLKLRLGIALQTDARSGVQLGRVWEVLHQAAPDLAALAARFGWPSGPWLVVHTYRQDPRRYHFLTVPEADRLFTEGGGFTREQLQTPSGEFGERCPILVYRRRG